MKKKKAIRNILTVVIIILLFFVVVVGIGSYREQVSPIRWIITHIVERGGEIEMDTERPEESTNKITGSGEEWDGTHQGNGITDADASPVLLCSGYPNEIVLSKNDGSNVDTQSIVLINENPELYFMKYFIYEGSYSDGLVKDENGVATDSAELIYESDYISPNCYVPYDLYTKLTDLYPSKDVVTIHIMVTGFMEDGRELNSCVVGENTKIYLK